MVSVLVLAVDLCMKCGLLSVQRAACTSGRFSYCGQTRSQTVLVGGDG
jgi:hypothetical protein